MEVCINRHHNFSKFAIIVGRIWTLIYYSLLSLESQQANFNVNNPKSLTSHGPKRQTSILTGRTRLLLVPRKTNFNINSQEPDF